MSEPLIPLARAVFYEVARVEEELGVALGAVRLDIEKRTVVVEGTGLLEWGPRTRLEVQLERCGVRHETHAPSMRIVVYPS